MMVMAYLYVTCYAETGLQKSIKIFVKLDLISSSH
jgi:hypothetical protein